MPGIGPWLEKITSTIFRKFSSLVRSPTRVRKKYRKSSLQGERYSTSASLKTPELFPRTFSRKVLPVRGNPTTNTGGSYVFIAPSKPGGSAHIVHLWVQFAAPL